MKIRDIISEDVDMSWWKEKDELFNPEALEYAEKQEKRQKIINKSSNGTKVFRKPVRKAQEPFSNKPKDDALPSRGHVGNVDVQVKAGHITKKEGEDLV